LHGRRARKIGGEWEHKCSKCAAGLDWIPAIVEYLSQIQE